jgi:hypothetical protein
MNLLPMILKNGTFCLDESSTPPKWESESVIGSNRWQSATTFDKLRVPENDTNIVLSYHFYEPFFLTLPGRMD